MTWILALLLALMAFIIAVFVLRAPRKGWEAIGAFLLLGIAGYAMQASPSVPAAPKHGREQPSIDPKALVEARASVTNSGIPTGDRWIIVADGLARNGQFGGAALMLRNATNSNPKNAEAWLAMANALVAHAENQLTPAAFYAYRSASAVAPEHPGPPFFLGLALAQSGRFTEARTLWARLLEATPPNAPWHDELVDKLAKLDAIIKQGASRQQTQAPQR